MGLLDRYHLTIQQAEAALKRPLQGDPSEGEVAVIFALNKDRIDDARQRLAHERHVRNDFREFVEDHLRRAVERARRNKLWNVRITGEAFDYYAEQARRENVSIQTCLEQAILRDYEQIEQGRNLLRSLNEEVRACNVSLAQGLTQFEGLIQRAGPLQELSMQMKRLEGVVQSLARAVGAARN